MRFLDVKTDYAFKKVFGRSVGCGELANRIIRVRFHPGSDDPRIGVAIIPFHCGSHDLLTVKIQVALKLKKATIFSHAKMGITAL